jgi:predicted aconitase with swiveling domain
MRRCGVQREDRVIAFRAAAAMGQRLRGRALVAKDGFSARYDLDRVNGVFSRPEHRLAGQSYVDRILVLDTPKGGVATAWVLNEMKARGVVPAALVLNAVNPIMVQGAALADFTMISGFDVDITQAIPNGALVEVDTTGERPSIRVIWIPCPRAGHLADAARRAQHCCVHWKKIPKGETP